MKIKNFTKLPMIEAVTTSDGIAWVYLYLNETETEEPVVTFDGKGSEGTETTETRTMYEYEYTEFHAPVSDLDIADIKANPEKYADYRPAEKATDLERIEAQVMYTALLTDTLIEGGESDV